MGLILLLKLDDVSKVDRLKGTSTEEEGPTRDHSNNPWNTALGYAKDVSVNMVGTGWTLVSF
jgi:hypothetical protein